MGWKNWPSWLKGSLILSGLYLILFIILSLVISPLIKGIYGGIIGYANYILLYIVFPVINIVGMTIIHYIGITIFPNSLGLLYNFYIVLNVIINLALYFVIGALIGWYIGKIRQKKK